MTLKVSSKKVAQNRDIEHQRLTSLINSMADAVIAVDEKAKVVLYNASALNILDVNNIKKGVRLSTLVKPIDENNQSVDLTEMVLGLTVPQTNRDLRLEYSDGSIINLYVSIAPVRLGYGEKGQGGYVLLFRDITREKSLEEERDEFISVVSHELRTPIAITEGNISNAIFIAQKSGDIEQIKKALDEAHNQVMLLADMINDLSTLSRAERGVLQAVAEPINVHKLMQELLRNYQPSAEKKGLRLYAEIDPKLEILTSTELYVHEVLQNFITNSIKYTQKGSVKIQARKSPKGVTFKVHDTGIGISKGDQERVFDKFFRSEDFRTREANGTGMGLYITMKLARIIHAEISLESELNKGSVFTIYVPDLEQAKD